MALVLSRKRTEKIFLTLGDGQCITIIHGGTNPDGSTRLVIEAPEEVIIDREEVHDKKVAALEAAQFSQSMDVTVDAYMRAPAIRRPKLTLRTKDK